MAIDSAKLTQIIVSIIGAVVVALQGVSLNNTGIVAQEAARVETEQKQELQTIQEMQERMKTLVSQMRDNAKLAPPVYEALRRIEAKLGITDPSLPPLPSPTPTQ